MNMIDDQALVDSRVGHRHDIRDGHFAGELAINPASIGGAIRGPLADPRYYRWRPRSGAPTPSPIVAPAPVLPRACPTTAPGLAPKSPPKSAPCSVFGGATGQGSGRQEGQGNKKSEFAFHETFLLISAMPKRDE